MTNKHLVDDPLITVKAGDDTFRRRLGLPGHVGIFQCRVRRESRILRLLFGNYLVHISHGDGNLPGGSNDSIMVSSKLKSN
jgi:hypothetical protein